jgi:hypothetical protein
MDVAIAKFTLRARPGTGVEVPDPNSTPPPPNNPGDKLLVVDRLLEDRNGNLCGTLVFRSVIIKKLAAEDLVVTFDATYKLGKGAINTQGVIRFADMFTSNGVTFAMVGGYRHVQDGSWHGDSESR